MADEDWPDPLSPGLQQRCNWGLIFGIQQRRPSRPFHQFAGAPASTESKLGSRGAHSLVIDFPLAAAVVDPTPCPRRTPRMC